MMRTVFRNGSILRDAGSSEPLLTSSGALVLVDDGRIVEVGDAVADALSDAPSAAATETVDLDGGVIAPAFGDGHAHLPQGGLEKLGPSIRDAQDVAGIVTAVADWARQHPDDEWIIGGSYESTLAPDGLFDARWLDEACPDRPVMLHSWDYHTVWANSLALRLAGIDAATPEPALGRIPRRGDGSPLGVLQEPGAVGLLDAVAPPRTRAERVEAIRLATADYAALGMSWVQDAWVEPEDLNAYLCASRIGALGLRVNLAQRADPLRWREQLAAFADGRRRVRDLGDPLLTADTVKFFVDGIVESYTAAMLDDYADRPGDRGLPNWDPAELAAAAVAFDARGFQLHLHAIGDAANRLALDVIEAVRRTNGDRDRRPVIAHAHVVHPDDLARFAELGVVANLQPLWARNDAVMTELTVPHLGPERATWQYSLRGLEAAGARLSFGSDWPVSSADWRPAVATAVTRRAPGHPEEPAWLPEQRIDVHAALAGYTTGVAWQAFAEERRGRIAPGYDADLVWLDRDPRAEDADALIDLAIRGTWVAGIRRHTARTA